MYFTGTFDTVPQKERNYIHSYANKRAGEMSL